MQASSEHSVCFAVPEKEVKAVSEALHSRFRQALAGGRLSQVPIDLFVFFERNQLAMPITSIVDEQMSTTHLENRKNLVYAWAFC